MRTGLSPRIGNHYGRRVQCVHQELLFRVVLLLRKVFQAFGGVLVKEIILGDVENVHEVVFTVSVATAVGHLVNLFNDLLRLQYLVVGLLPLPVQHLPHLIFVALRVSGEKDLDICKEDHNMSGISSRG